MMLYKRVYTDGPTDITFLRVVAYAFKRTIITKYGITSAVCQAVSGQPQKKLKKKKKKYTIAGILHEGPKWIPGKGSPGCSG